MPGSSSNCAHLGHRGENYLSGFVEGSRLNSTAAFRARVECELFVRILNLLHEITAHGTTPAVPGLKV
jgi:hypothetical protein